MTEKHEFIRWLRAKHACDAGVEFAKRFRTPQEAWERAVNRGRLIVGRDWGFMDWLLFEARHPFYSAAEETRRMGKNMTAAAIRKHVPRIPWKRGMR